jgi:hypothetical protein
VRHHAVVRRAQVSRAPIVGVGNVPGCLYGSPTGLPVLQLYRARILRVVVDPTHGATGSAAACVQAAAAAGYRVHVSIGYSNSWSVAHDVAYFSQVLRYYGRYAWAISIGNEQELFQGGTKSSPAHYAAVWRAVEPVVARVAPHALRVAGEVSPWGFDFLRAVVKLHLRGAQAISVHAYSTRLGFNLARVAAWARGTRLPLWVTEGLSGPHAWHGSHHREHAVSLSGMGGVAVADAWLG